jgi:hypothetical protein
MLIGVFISILGLLITFNSEKVKNKIIMDLTTLAENTNYEVSHQLVVKSNKKVKIIFLIISISIIAIGVLLIIGVDPKHIIRNILWVLGPTLIIFSRKVAAWNVAVGIKYYDIHKSVIVNQIAFIFGGCLIIFIALVFKQ